MVRASLGLESWMEFFYVEIFFLSFFSMFCLKNAGEPCPAAVSTDPTNEQQHESAEADTQVEEALNSTVPFYCMLTVKACILFYVVFLLLPCSLCLLQQTVPDTQPPVKTIGPLTDADVIKLRPCEKKQVLQLYLPQKRVQAIP